MIPRWKRASALRRRNALRDSTWRNYCSSFKLFFSFCLNYKCNPLDCNQEVFNTFTEMLIENHFKSRNIVNILTGIKTVFTWTGLNTEVFSAKAWSRNMSSIDRTLREPYRIQSSMSLEHLIRLIKYMDNRPKWRGLVLFLLLAFFGLFRLSNLVPKTRNSVDKTRNTLVKDIFPSRCQMDEN